MRQQFTSLRDVATAQADINEVLSAGNTFGEIAERVAAEITGAVRITGTGRDLRAPARQWRRPSDPEGLSAPGPVRTPYSQASKNWPERDRRRYEAWRRDPAQLGEVKARQLDRRWPADEQLVDTRGGGPGTPFFPLVDFYVFVLFDLDGDIAMARRLELREMITYVAGDVGRGGSWNYKIAIGLRMDAGTDLTEHARASLRDLPASPQIG